MTVFPESRRRQGFGSQAIVKVLQWARNNGFNEVRATQIDCSENEAFWAKNGFVKEPEPNDCNDFVHRFTYPPSDW